VKCGGLTRKSKGLYLVVLEVPGFLGLSQQEGLKCRDNKFSLVTDLEVIASLRVPVV
jgi:hypothetical protein